MIDIQDSRWIASKLDAADVARLAWRASVDEYGEVCNAAAILDLRSGRVVYRSWPRDRRALWGASNVLLAVVSAARREDVEAKARRGATMPPSGEVLEEGVVRAAVSRGLDYADIEHQIRHAYEVYGEGAA